jgi:hypothetical protein
MARADTIISIALMAGYCLYSYKTTNTPIAPASTSSKEFANG